MTNAPKKPSAGDASRPIDGAQCVALLGLGLMGRALTVPLSRARWKVRAWTRSNRPVEPQPGLVLLAHAAEAVAPADFVIAMLADAAAVDDLLFKRGIAAHIRAGALFIDMGTTGPKAAREHARLLAKRGIDYLDAPVSGGVGGAEAGNLTIFVGGDVAPYERALPLLTSVGRPRRLGASGAGQAAKLVNQIIVAVNIAALAEALRVGERQGLSSTDLIEALQGGFADSTVLRQHGPRMAQRNYEPGGPCRMHLKDLRLVQELLEGDFPLLAHTSRSLQGFEQLVASGYADADHSAYFELYAALASDSSEHP